MDPLGRPRRIMPAQRRTFHLPVLSLGGRFIGRRRGRAAGRGRPCGGKASTATRPGPEKGVGVSGCWETCRLLAGKRADSGYVGPVAAAEVVCLAVSRAWKKTWPSSRNCCSTTIRMSIFWAGTLIWNRMAGHPVRCDARHGRMKVLHVDVVFPEDVSGFLDQEFLIRRLEGDLESA